MPIFRGSSDATLGSGQIVATQAEIVDALNSALAAQAAAETAETNAQIAQAAAEAALDNFDDRYLGAKTSDPTVDNDGDPLIDGALYYNTTDNVTKVYDLGTTTWLNLLLTASDQANVNTVVGIASDVTTVAGIDSDVTTVAGISSDVTTVSGINADVTTVANNDANVTIVATDITNVNTVATNIADVNTVAGISADVTTVAGISSDVTTVALDSVDIGVVATNIADVTIVASISGDVTDVAGVASDIPTVAAIDSEVSIVATNVTDITNFSDVYIGPSATEPTTRLDGSPLQEGDLYFDTSLGSLRAYDGSSWASLETLTDQEIRNKFSAGGDLNYNSTTGEFSVTLADEASDVSYDNSTSGLTATDVQDAIDELETDKAETDLFTTTIGGSDGSSDWTGSDPYVATMTVSGILSADVPIADIDLSSVAFADVADTQSDWALVYRVEASADDEVKFYATEEPAKDLDVQIKVVR